MKSMADVKNMLIYMAESMNSMKLETESLVGKMSKESREMREEVKQLRQDIGMERKKDRERLEAMEKRLETWEKKIGEVKSEEKIKEIEEKLNDMWERNNAEGSVERRNTIKKMEDLLERKDREDRKNNVIIKGMAFREYGQRLRAETEKFIEEKINVKAEVVHARKIGKGNMTVVKLGSLEQKIDIMKNKSKLGSTDIYIENDRTIKEREIQRKIVAVAKGEKDKNKETDIKISHWKLRINGKWYKWNDYKSRLEEQVFHA